MPSSAPQPEQLHFSSDGRTPNSAHPVLVYRQLPLADTTTPAPSEPCSTATCGRRNGVQVCMTTITTIPRLTRCSAFRGVRRG